MAVYGREAMHQMRSAHVLISGLNGLGCEIAKNVILSNVGRVTLHGLVSTFGVGHAIVTVLFCNADEQDVTVEDLGSQFYVRASDIGHNRANACLPHLKSLISAAFRWI